MKAGKIHFQNMRVQYFSCSILAWFLWNSSNLVNPVFRPESYKVDKSDFNQYPYNSTAFPLPKL